MKILFVADALDTFKIYKDSTYAMMKQGQIRHHTIYHCHVHDIFWQSGSSISAHVSSIEIDLSLDTDNKPAETSVKHWFKTKEECIMPLSVFNAIVMRKDPPFDNEYFYATHLLEQAQREGAKVFNSPQALRNHPEKLAILEFPQFIPPTLVTKQAAHIKAFHAQHRDIILKPLDGMGGAGIFRVKDDGLNLGAIIETLNQNDTQTIMVQKFIPDIAQGDKRILIIDGQVVPYSLARIPQGNEVRGNLAAGGKGIAQPLTQQDTLIANNLAAVLASRGLFLIGIDIIGHYLTEINVTSPTCFQEIEQQSGHNVAQQFIQALEKVA